MLVGVRICEIFSRKSSLKERALRASLLPRMLPLWPDDPGAPGVTDALSPPFSVTGAPGELVAAAVLEVVLVVVPPELLAILDALLRGVALVEVDIVALEPEVVVSQSLILLLLLLLGPAEVDAGALARSPFGVAMISSLVLVLLRFDIRCVRSSVSSAFDAMRVLAT